MILISLNYSAGNLVCLQMGQSYLSFTIFMCAMVTFCGAHIQVRRCCRSTAALLQLCCISASQSLRLLRQQSLPARLAACSAACSTLVCGSRIKTAGHLPQADSYAPPHLRTAIACS